jgi:hypothetical protein
VRVRCASAYYPTGELLREALADVDAEYELNWGSSTRNHSGPYINDPARVGFAAQKGDAKYVMMLAGVPTPRVYSPGEAKYSMIVDGERWMVGRRNRTSQGRRFRTANSLSTLEGWTHDDPEITHWCERVECDEEYRVHVINGRCIKISEKVGGIGWVRNHRNQWTFRVPVLPRDERGPLRDAARAAVKALGLDFGAVDVGRNSRTGEVWCFEVNTAPALTDSTSNTLAKYVRVIT